MPVNHRFWLFKRKGVYYIQDGLTRKRESLRTSDRKEAERLRAAKDESVAQPALNLAIARAYLSGNNPAFLKRTWAQAIEKLCSIGQESTRMRKARELQRKTYDPIRNKVMVETTADELFAVMGAGSTATLHYLRCLHNLACGLGWLPWEIIPARLWPVPRAKARRAITRDEHQAILVAEKNPERNLFYRMLWEIGSGQSDAASLTASHIDWEERTLSFQRRKTGQWCHLSIGEELEVLLRQLPAAGPLFPHLSTLSANDRSAEFYRRCRLLGIQGVSLHSYRYAWAERAKAAGYPERFAMQHLGHGSNSVTRAYAKSAKMKVPPLDAYEKGLLAAKGASPPRQG